MKRPVLRYHGGKWVLAKWIISHFSEHKSYIEPFGGGASVLLQKKPAGCEVYNDLDSTIVNVFKVLRDPGKAEKLIEALKLTPFSRDEFNDAYKENGECDIEKARKTIVRSFMGFSSDSSTRKARTGFRSTNFNSGRHASKDWPNYPEKVRYAISRLTSVVIENMDALECIEKYDHDDSLFYLDPPYLPETRHKINVVSYNHEMTKDDHINFLDKVLKIKGMVIISGYNSTLYNDAFGSYKKVMKTAQSQAHNGYKYAEEFLWISQNCIRQKDLFSKHEEGHK